MSYTFIHENDPKWMIPVVEQRLPLSCNVHNQIKKYDKYKDCVRFYTIGKSSTSGVWIVSIYNREDYGINVTISVPPSISNGSEEISEAVKECFTSTDILPWDDSIIFFSLPRPVSRMIFDISVTIKKNITKVNPCYMYYIDKGAELKANFHHPYNVTVSMLQTQDAPTIASSWKYFRPETEQVFSKCIARSASAGVFLHGLCVSGCITLGHGFYGALFTLNEHRGKGYAKLAAMHIFKNMIKDECIPCLIVEIKNKASIGLHEALGMNRAQEEVDLVFVMKTEYE